MLNHKYSLTAILIFGLILRLIALNQSLWLDEAIQAWSATLPVHTLLSGYMVGDFNPPLYHLLLSGWTTLFGTSELGLRSLGVMLAVASIYLLYQLTLSATNSVSTSLTAALLLAVSPFHLYYSQEARMYVLVVFTVIVLIWRLLEYFHSRSTANLVWLCLGSSLVLYSHYVAWTLIFVVITCLFFFHRHQPLPRSHLLALFFYTLASLLLISPLLARQYHQAQTVLAQYPVWSAAVGNLSLKSLALLPTKFMLGRVSFTNKLLYALFTVFAGLTYLAGLSVSFLDVRKKIPLDYQVIIAWLIIPLLTALLLAFKISFFQPFRLIFVLPAIYVLLTWPLSRPGRTVRATKIIITLIGLISLAMSLYYLFTPSLHRENWRSAIAWSQSQANTILVQPEAAKPVEYYTNRAKIITPADLAATQPQSLVYVAYLAPIFDPTGTTQQTLRELGYQEVAEKYFQGDIRIFVYNKLTVK